MASGKTRSGSIERLDGGSFDVIVIGAGVCEAAIFATLAAKGIPVALISPADFASNTNQDVPNLINDAFEPSNKKTLLNTFAANSSIEHLGQSRTASVKKIGYLSLISKGDHQGINRTGTKMLATAAISRANKPKVLREDTIGIAHSTIASTELKGAIEHQTNYCPDGEGRLAFNLIHHATGNRRTAAVAANYLKVLSAVKHPGKPWEIELKDSLTGDCISLISKIVVQTKMLGVSSSPELTIASDDRWSRIRNTHLVLDQFYDGNKFIRVANRPNQRITVSPGANSNLVTVSKVETDSTVCYGDSDADQVTMALEAVNGSFTLPEPLQSQSPLGTWTTFSQRLVEYGDGTELCDIPQTPIRKQLTVDATRDLINLNGPRIASCYRLSKEVEKAVSRMGVEYKRDSGRWYTTDASTEEGYFLNLAADHGLDENSSDPQIAKILWRRHRSNAFGIIDIIDQNKELARPIIRGYDYIWAEVAAIRSNEMVTCLDDFMLRRTTLGQTLGRTIYSYIDKAHFEKALRITRETTATVIPFDLARKAS